MFVSDKVYLESYRGNRSEPAGLPGLRKHVAEAKEGPLELRRKKGKGNCLVGRGRKEKAQTCSQEESAGRKVLDHHKQNH